MTDIVVVDFFCCMFGKLEDNTYICRVFNNLILQPW